ncbi:MAG: hypothetical protein ACOC28_00120 [Alkalispirochaetaceae bacterium]
MAKRRKSILEQIQSDFAADDIRMKGSHLHAGEGYRAFLNVDTQDLFRLRADSHMGHHYVLFLATFIYNHFRLLPSKDTLSYQLIARIEDRKLRNHHDRLQRFGHGVGYIEYWDGSSWKVKAVPFADPDFQVRIPVEAPGEGTYEDDDLEELEAVDKALEDSWGTRPLLPGLKDQQKKA